MWSWLASCADLRVEPPVPSTWERRVERAAARVAELRGVEVTVPPVRVVAREELLATLVAAADRDLSPVQRERYRWQARAFGLDAAGDLTDPAVATRGVRLLGAYDPDEGVIRVVRGESLGERDEVLVHELVHAAQDQHLPVDELRRASLAWTTDLLVVASLLVEGEAVYAELIDRFGAERVDGTALARLGVRGIGPAGGWIDRYLRFNALAPYVFGPGVIQDLRRRGGWDAVDAAWREWPSSSAQLLADLPDHEPRRVDLDCGPALAPGWQASAVDTLGALATSALLWAALPGDIPAGGIVGWDGDAVQAFVHPDGRAGFVGRWVFDGNSEAEAFAGLARRWRPRGAPLTVERRSAEVALVSGVDGVESCVWEHAFREVPFAGGPGELHPR